MGQIPPVVGRQTPDGKHRRRTDQHGRHLPCRLPQHPADHRADERGAGVNMLHENIGHISGHHIPQQPAAHAGEYADEHQQVQGRRFHATRTPMTVKMPRPALSISSMNRS